MVIALSILSRLCFVWIIVYLIFSFHSSISVGTRHSQRLVFLEFQPYRARGTREIAKASLLQRMALCAALALPLGIATFVVGVVIS